MNLTLLKCKLHRATVTQADIDYEGSISIDRTLMEAVGLLEHEKVSIYNITNGERLSTYVIPAPHDSGTIGINGAAAKKVSSGDLVIICAYAEMTVSEAKAYTPTVILLDEDNKPKGTAK